MKRNNKIFHVKLRMLKEANMSDAEFLEHRWKMETAKPAFNLSELSSAASRLILVINS